MSASVGSPGSMRFRMPSRPAINMAEKARYALAEGSGGRNLDALAGGRRLVRGDADRRGAVARRVGQVDRRLEAGHKTLVGIGRGGAEGQQLTGCA